MVSTQPSENGFSESRKWGVKDHLERKAMQSPDVLPSQTFPYNWQELYRLERSTIEGLSGDASDKPPSNKGR